MNRAHDAGHLGAQRRKIAADISIISYLFDLAAFPRIPVASDGDENCQGEALQQGVSHVLFPSHPACEKGPQACRFLEASDFVSGAADLAGTGEVDIKFAHFRSKKSAFAAPFEIIHAKAIGSVCFSARGHDASQGNNLCCQPFSAFATPLTPSVRNSSDHSSCLGIGEEFLARFQSGHLIQVHASLGVIYVSRIQTAKGSSMNGSHKSPIRLIKRPAVCAKEPRLEDPG